MKYPASLLGICLFCTWMVPFLSGCDQQPSLPIEPVSRPVKLFTVGSGTEHRTYTYPGSISAVTKSELAFDVPGKITALHVKEGDIVEAGAILAQLDDRDYQAQLERAQSDKNTALAEFNRFETAFRSNAITAQALDQVKQAKDAAQAAFRQAQKAYEDTTLRAPFAGRVSRVLVENFANVHAKQAVIQLHSESALEMQVSVPESDWAQVKRVASASDIEVDGTLHVAVSAIPSERYEAMITEFSGSADPVTRTFKVTVGFSAPPSSNISPGMTGNVLYTPHPNPASAKLVPVDAVVSTTDNTPFVWVYDEAQAVSRRHVLLGEISGSHIQIKEGLAIGERIAVSGVHALYDGFPVHPLEGQ